jgi:transposase
LPKRLDTLSWGQTFELDLIMEDCLMPTPIPQPVRRAIFARSKKGASVGALVAEFGISERTVRHLVQRFDERGESGLVPDYANCATKTMTDNDAVRKKALQIREQHPGWGGGLIRVVLQKDLDACPSERTLQRWFRQAGLTPAPAGRRPASDDMRACRPHEVVQMDAAEHIRLRTGEQVSWLRWADECSGAVLKTVVFPPGALEPGRTHGGATSLAHGIFPVGNAVVVPN